MNIRVLVDPFGPLSDPPSRRLAANRVIHVTPDTTVFSSSGHVPVSEKVIPIVEILDVPLQNGVVNIGQSTKTWTRNLIFLFSDNNWQYLIKSSRAPGSNRPPVSDIGKKVYTTEQS